MVNRIALGIARYEARIQRNEKGATQADLDRLYRNLDVEPSELAAYFSTNARAFAEQKISLEESQQIYNILKDWPRASLAQRITVTQVIKELLTARIAAK